MQHVIFGYLETCFFFFPFGALTTPTHLPLLLSNESDQKHRCRVSYFSFLFLWHSAVFLSLCSLLNVLCFYYQERFSFCLVNNFHPYQDQVLPVWKSIEYITTTKLLSENHHWKQLFCVRKFSVAPGSCGQVGPRGQNVLEQDSEPWKPLLSHFLMNSCLYEWLALCILASITTSLMKVWMGECKTVKVLSEANMTWKAICINASFYYSIRILTCELLPR